jgi:type IV pilus assembly protein PilA
MEQGGNMSINKSKNSESGFSLVELMIVVAIIGILSSIAVPQFQKFIFKARQTEAKTGLSSLYTAEKAFYGEWSQYSSVFGTVGYMPEGKYFYNIGFGAATPAAPVLNFTESASPEFNTVAYCTTNATKCKSMASASSAAATGAVNNTTLTFIATAQAKSLNPDGIDDNWKINESKALDNL